MTCRLLLSLCLCLLPAALWAQTPEKPPLRRGQVVFETRFEGAAALKGWTGKAALEPGYEGGHALAIQRTATSGNGSAMVVLQLPVEALRGYQLRFSAKIKAQDVSRKPQAWNGVKFMAPIVTPDGKEWPAASLDAGSFDWQSAGFAVRVPDDATSLSLCLGLEAVTGKAWFDEIRVTVGKPPIVRTPRVATGPAYKGHNLPRLRGAMVRATIDEESLRVFGQEWNANVIRWQLTRPGNNVADPLDLNAYDKWLQGALRQMEAMLPICEKYGILVVVDLHSPPGGRKTSGGYAGSDSGLFNDPTCQRKFVEIWQYIARRYKNVKAIWGYDLANEPVENSLQDDLADWQDLALKTARAIRAIDPERTIIVEPAMCGGPSGFRELQPLDIPNVVYSVHMYVPGTFTHQGVHSQGKPVAYPGECEGKMWDKAQLEAALKPVIDFQKAYNAHIYLGEFSAIRWAPDNSAYRYIKDVIEICEAHDWDWTYHAFREWDGWSVEHGPDRNDRSPAKTPTDREQLLRSWLAKNRKPVFNP
jgi:hypothetical protein